MGKLKRIRITFSENSWQIFKNHASLYWFLHYIHSAMVTTQKPAPVSSAGSNTGSSGSAGSSSGNTQVVPTAVPVQPTSPSVQNAVCDCSGDTLNCGDFSTHNAAQACHDYCVATVGRDVHRLDGNDNDGLACESLP